jgi:hypothetical protein
MSYCQVVFCSLILPYQINLAAHCNFFVINQMLLCQYLSRQQNNLISIPMSLTSFCIELLVYTERSDLEEHIWS